MNELPSMTPAKKLTDFQHLNLFSTEVRTARGTFPWIFASRKIGEGSRPEKPDAVAIIAVIRDSGEARLVVTREYRAPLRAYEIGPPAGLVDDGESAAETAKRELREETGLDLTRVVQVSPPLASSAGLTDETVALVYGEATGTPSRQNQTEHETIEIRLLTLAEIRELLTNRTTDVISSRLYPILMSYLSAGAIRLPIAFSGVVSSL